MKLNRPKNKGCVIGKKEYFLRLQANTDGMDWPPKGPPERTRIPKSPGFWDLFTQSFPNPNSARECSVNVNRPLVEDRSAKIIF